MTQIVLTSGTTWTVPTDCNLIDTLELWGGNASGAGPQSTSGQAGGGGGAGAYGRWTAIAVTPGSVLTIAIGAGGPRKSASAGTDGGATSFIKGATTWQAAGGSKGLSGTGGTGGAGGAGGAAPTSPAPAAAFKGGDGAAGVAASAAGGGGGSPGSTGAGGNGSGSTGGAGGTGSPAGTAGGAGGTSGGTKDGADGSSPSGTGTPGSAGGGGYWNGSTASHSGAGGSGQIVINYTTTGSGGDIPPARVADLIGFDPGRGNWTTAEATIGPGDTHRLFSSGALPATFDADGTPSHVTIIQSYKTMNTNVAAYVNSIPDTRDVILIYHHEPEADYALGSQFVAEFKTQSDLIRAQGRSNVRVAMCAGGYAYRDNGSADVLAGNYLRGLGPYVDLFTKDIYQGSGGVGSGSWPSQGLANYSYWTNWLSLVTSTSVVGQVRPLGLTEYGVDDPVGNTARNARIQLDHDYLMAAFTPGGPQAVSPFPLACWCYWWTDADPANPAQFTDAPTIATWRSYETAAGPSGAPGSLDSTVSISLPLTTMLTGPVVAPPDPGTRSPTRPGWAVWKVEAGFTAAVVGTVSTDLILNDAARGILDTNTLATSTIWADISAWVEDFTIERPGTRQQGPIFTYEAGSATVTLNNSDGRFVPNNPTSPYVVGGVSQIRPMIPLRITATWDNTTYPLFNGFVSSWTPPSEWTGQYAQTTIAATDATRILENTNFPTVSPVGTGELSGARVTRILDAAGWYGQPFGLRVIGTGASTLAATTFGAGAYQMLQDVALTEIGEVYVNGAGAIVFRDRNAPITETRSNTVQAIFGDAGGTGTGGGYAATYAATYPALIPSTELPYTALSNPTDDTALANDIQATRDGGVMQEATDLASVALYLFPRTYAADGLLLQDDAAARDWANYVLYLAGGDVTRFDEMTLMPVANPALVWPQALGRELGDRIQVKRRPPGTSSPLQQDVFIRGISHEVTVDGWITTWTLQDATRYGSIPSGGGGGGGGGGGSGGALVLDSATQGILNTNTLGF